VYDPAESAYTLPLFHLYPICTLCTVHTPPPPKYFTQVLCSYSLKSPLQGAVLWVCQAVLGRDKKRSTRTRVTNEEGTGGEGREREKKEESCLSLDLSSCPPAAPFLYLYTLQQRELKRRTGPVVFAFFIFKTLVDYFVLYTQSRQATLT
jgi:hypothetical protein